MHVVCSGIVQSGSEERGGIKTGVLKHIVIFDIILLNINYIYKVPFNLLIARLLVYDIPSSVPVLHNQIISITCRYVGNIFKI